MREYLEKSVLQGPFPNAVEAKLRECNSRAEQAFEQGDYNVAQWWLALLDEFWLYVAHLRPHHLEGGRRRICKENKEIYEILRRSFFKCYEGLMKIVKACLQQLKYKEADKYLDDAFLMTKDEEEDFGYRATSTMEVKLQLCAYFELIARGKIGYGKAFLEVAVERLINLWDHSTGRVLHPGWTSRELTEDFKQTINNELIRVGSLWRCDRNTTLSPTPRSGPEWQIGVVQRSFWEWMELPDYFDGLDDLGLTSEILDSDGLESD